MTIYRMIRTVGITDAQEQLNEMVRCLEKGDHIYIQDIDPLTPDYELPDVTPDEYKSTLKKYYGNRLLKDHWNGFTQWDYYFLKELPKPKPMEYPPEYIDTEKEKAKTEEKKADKSKKKDKSGKKKMTFYDIFFSSNNKRVKKEPIQEEPKEELPKKPEEPTKVTFDILNEEPEKKQPAKERKPRKLTIKEPVTPKKESVPETEIPEEPTSQKTPAKTRKTRTKKAKQPMNTEDMEKILRYDEEMEKKIQSMTENFEGKKKEEE